MTDTKRAVVGSGSYENSDVQFLLKNLNGLMQEDDLHHREQAIQSGVHYSEMLPVEYEPSDHYIRLYESALDHYKSRVALAVGIVAERILNQKGQNLVLVSLARAGTPIGILIKRYMKEVYQLDLPHYSVSIIRGRGLDENAIHHINREHPDRDIQFIDGWTGKGAITNELEQSCQHLKDHGVEVDPTLAVLADPGHCSELYGTREDFLIPNACLNSTVSGLISRTVLHSSFIGDDDFHGAKVYEALHHSDRSKEYIQVISQQFKHVYQEARAVTTKESMLSPSWQGYQDVLRIQERYDIHSLNHIKPGVGETTRVLLRRMPWKVLVSDQSSPALRHIVQLAKEKQVPIEEYQDMSYACCGLIKQL